MVVTDIIGNFQLVNGSEKFYRVDYLQDGTCLKVQFQTYEEIIKERYAFYKSIYFIDFERCPPYSINIGQYNSKPFWFSESGNVEKSLQTLGIYESPGWMIFNNHKENIIIYDPELSSPSAGGSYHKNIIMNNFKGIDFNIAHAVLIKIIRNTYFKKMEDLFPEFEMARLKLLEKCCSGR